MQCVSKHSVSENEHRFKHAMHAGIRRQPEKSKSQAVTVFVCGEGNIKHIMLTRRA